MTLTLESKSIIQTLRLEIKSLARAQRLSQSLARRFRLCAMHQLLNQLRGKPNAHELTSGHKPYTAAHMLVMVELVRQELENSSHPLRLYITVTWVAKTAAQKMVQAAHVLSEFVDMYRDHPRMQKWLTQDKTLIVCEHAGGAPYVGNVHATKAGMLSGMLWHKFVDPDIDEWNPTAFAFFPMTQEEAEQREVSKLKLYSPA